MEFGNATVPRIITPHFPLRTNRDTDCSLIVVTSQAEKEYKWVFLNPCVYHFQGNRFKQPPQMDPSPYSLANEFTKSHQMSFHNNNSKVPHVQSLTR